MPVLSVLQKPVYQLLFIQLLSVVVLVIYRPSNVDSSWTASGLCYILFILINSIFIWSAPRLWVYFFTSLGFSILYVLLAYLVLWAFNELLKLKGSGESGMIFLVIIYHPFLLLLVVFLKWVYGKII
ncbi:hypothetical protein [Fulvivirga imtechensis]|uniref:hypothetical protein n=1 Tax=Fulvivirga imtechensis TaxID=881893 RepID=UPI00058BAB02|nr:hypothetical protein [Fulvivirga imtechensis]